MQALLFFLDPDFERETEPVDILAVSKRRSRIQVAVTVTSVSVFCILLLGAVFRYQFLRAHKHKHDIFIDVSGTTYPSFISFPLFGF